jgi:hypothetical protein
MQKSAPADPASSNWPRIALAVLVIALIGAGAYIFQLHGQVAQRDQRAAAPARPADSAPAAGAAAVGDAAASGVLTPQQEQTMVTALRTVAEAERRAWFQVQANNQTTAPVQAALQRVFEQAGWTTATVRSPYPLKSGIFILAGDETPPGSVDAVNGAFGTAGIDVQYLTGYRAFFNDRKLNNPNWVGPELAKDQSFIIVIGSRPAPKPQQ